MQLILISEMRRARQMVLDALKDRDMGNVLIVDSASVGSPGAPAIRGGTATGVYRDLGSEVKIVDPLTSGPVDLSDVDVIHFTGGDPFRLLRACHASGLQGAMETRDLIRPLSIVGSSAGAMVFGEEVSHASILCSPGGLEHTRGFGWVQGRIMPHMDMRGPYGDKIRAHVDANPDEDWTLLDDADCLVEEVSFDVAISMAP